MKAIVTFELNKTWEDEINHRRGSITNQDIVMVIKENLESHIEFCGEKSPFQGILGVVLDDRNK